LKRKKQEEKVEDEEETKLFFVAGQPHSGLTELLAGHNPLLGSAGVGATMKQAVCSGSHLMIPSARGRTALSGMARQEACRPARAASQVLISFTQGAMVALEARGATEGGLEIT
jgi:hypothetical protein